MDGQPYPPIGDYAIIGDCRSAALVSRDGDMDWLCWPRFDAPSVFGALIDQRRGGRFRLRPAAPFTVQRNYGNESNLLETHFQAPGGSLRLRDAMVIGTRERRRFSLVAQRQIIRQITGTGGAVQMEALFEPRWNYGLADTVLELRDGTVVCPAGRGVLMLRASVPLQLAGDRRAAVARWTLRAGDVCHFSLTYDENGPAVLPSLGAEADALLNETEQWWQHWAARCKFGGELRPAVVRSLLALKLLAYSPSGAVIAAPTTSLPESPGGERNWDYRYCWLRDSALTVRAFLRLGYEEEANAFLGWLLHTTKNTWPQLRVLYDVYGRPPIRERVLDHLEGYGGARPVRIGNGADEQLQLDVYGEVVQAAWEYELHGANPDAVDCRALAALGVEVCRRWRLPDRSIWESRAAGRHHTYSKVMCWVALDRLARLNARGRLRAPGALFEAAAREIKAAVEREGYDRRQESYVSAFGGTDVDASLLRLPAYGYIAPNHPRMAATYRRLRSELATPNGLMRRYVDYPDGLPAGEGAFLACTFWEAEYLAAAGQREAAVRALTRVQACANDVGLFSEEAAPESGAAWGNFPQSYSHVGFIVAALATARGTAT